MSTLGIFDSGSGGLSVARAILERAPNADVLYFGDLANAPYGTKDRETLELLTLRAMRLLRAEGADTLIAACNSVSASVIRPMLSLFGVRESDVVEMVQPLVRALSGCSFGRVVVIATPATVRSGMYQECFAAAGMRVGAVACGELAPAIDAGEPAERLRGLVSAAVDGALSLGADTLVLGCTHFPLVSQLFEGELARRGSAARIIDPARAVAAEVIARTGASGRGTFRALVSKDVPSFRSHLADLCRDRPFTVELAGATLPAHRAIAQ